MHGATGLSLNSAQWQNTALLRRALGVIRSAFNQAFLTLPSQTPELVMNSRSKRLEVNEV
jgi:hypothetical protein